MKHDEEHIVRGRWSERTCASSHPTHNCTESLSLEDVRALAATCYPELLFGPWWHIRYRQCYTIRVTVSGYPSALVRNAYEYNIRTTITGVVEHAERWGFRSTITHHPKVMVAFSHTSTENNVAGDFICYLQWSNVRTVHTRQVIEVSRHIRDDVVSQFGSKVVACSADAGPLTLEETSRKYLEHFRQKRQK